MIQEDRAMKTLLLAAGVLAAGLNTPAFAEDAGAVKTALGETKPIFDLRLRSETVDQDGLANDAHATTLRARLGFETGKVWNTALLIEGEGIVPIQDDYRPDPMIATMTTYPVVADPESYKVNRLFGEDSPQGDYDGDSVLLNASYQTKIGKFTAFTYLLDFENIAAVPAAVRDSTNTYGLRFGGEKPVGKVKLAYTASYANQADYADNPLDFKLDYLFGELTATYKQFSFGYGLERMEGNGVKGFTTPLATLHKFNGWADKFLTTPANGLDDQYLTGGVALKSVGVFDTLALNV